MSWLHLLLLPAVIMMAWALYTKYQQNKTTDLIILSVTAVAVLVNVYVVRMMILGDISTGMHLLQMTAAAVIIPLAYLYFSRQVGTQIPNSKTLMLLWLIAALTFIPEIIIVNPFRPISIPEYEYLPFSIYIFSGGKKVLGIHTGDVATIIQALITLVRLVMFMLALRSHRLHLSGKVYAFGMSWLLIIVFVVMVSGMSYEDMRSDIGSCFYFAVYSILLSLTNFLIAKGYDIYPIETDDNNEIVENLSAYVIQQYDTIADQLRRLMNDEELYKDPQISAERVIELLHTNHTYFSQMMSTEMGMSFSEYLNSLRLSQVERLLPDDSLTIASIATMSGFSDASYMSRKFKAKHGMTPTEWRKGIKSPSPALP